MVMFYEYIFIYKAIGFGFLVIIFLLILSVW